MRYVDLDASGYYFLATDTPNVIRWLASHAQQAGVELACGTSFTGATKIRGGYHLDGLGDTRYLIGADGPNSQVAKSLALGQNQKFLFGMEYEFAGLTLAADDRLHCFLDRKLAPGYIGWMVPGVGVTQIGLARRMPRDPEAMKRVMEKFLDKVAPFADVRGREPTSIRAGAIPCGGVVRPVATERALLVGDAAGMVSPVTAGGIHTALKHGLAAGHAVAEFLEGKCEDPQPVVRRNLSQVPHQAAAAFSVRSLPKRLALQRDARLAPHAHGRQPSLLPPPQRDETTDVNNQPYHLRLDRSYRVPLLASREPVSQPNPALLAIARHSQVVASSVHGGDVIFTKGREQWHTSPSSTHVNPQFLATISTHRALRCVSSIQNRITFPNFSLAFEPTPMLGSARRFTPHSDLFCHSRAGGNPDAPPTCTSESDQSSGASPRFLVSRPPAL